MTLLPEIEHAFDAVDRRRYRDEVARAQIDAQSGPAWNALVERERVKEERRREREWRDALAKAALAEEVAEYGAALTSIQRRLIEVGKVDVVKEQIEVDRRRREIVRQERAALRRESALTAHVSRMLCLGLPGTPSLLFGDGWRDVDQGALEAEHDYALSLIDPQLADVFVALAVGDDDWDGLWFCIQDAARIEAARVEKVKPPSKSRSVAVSKASSPAVDYEARIVELLTDNEEGPSQKQIRNAVPGNDKDKLAALKKLIAADVVVTKTGIRGSIRHYLADDD